MSRSTWACELKSPPSADKKDTALSRSTWACELKSPWILYIVRSECHAPRERVSWNEVWAFSDNVIATSRSTWACELKSNCRKTKCYTFGHAPRERVSWNTAMFGSGNEPASHAPRERVSWNHVYFSCGIVAPVTLHVSVWVEMPMLSC